MIKINKDVCIGCGLCAKDCVMEQLTLRDGKAESMGPCLFCGHCVAVCPQKAITIPNYEMEEVKEYNEADFQLNPVHFLNAVMFRRSIRQYQKRIIETDKLKRVLMAGQYTATAVNRQDVRFILVQEELEMVKPLIWEGWLAYAKTIQESDPKQAYSIQQHAQLHQQVPQTDRLFFQAPALLVIAADIPLDGGLAAANIEMMAVAEGLGALYNGYIVRAINHSREAQDWLGLDGKTIAACMLLGYPDVHYQRTAPRRAADIIWK